jgi:hypothetical protein
LQRIDLSDERRRRITVKVRKARAGLSGVDQADKDKPIGMYITRWTDRVLPKNLVKTLQQTGWRDSKAQLYAAVHGTKPIDPEILQAERAGIVTVRDFRNKTTGRCPQIFKCAYLDGIDNHKIVGTMDDDAFYKDPVDAMERFLCGFEKHNAGALGPMHYFRRYAQYGGNAGDSFHSVAKRPWCTDGSQIFLSEFLLEVKDMWSRYLDEAYFEPTYWLYMVAYAQGYEVLETFVGYDHTSLQGSTRGDRTPEGYAWMIRRMAEVRADYALARRTLAEEYPQFLEEIHTIEQNNLKRIRKRFYAVKLNQRQDGIQIPRTLSEEQLEAHRKIIEDFGLD